jgi:glucosamine-6-phosphate deaminase
MDNFRGSSEKGNGMQVRICDSGRALGDTAAEEAAAWVRRCLDERGEVTLVAATGASQFEFLDALAEARDIDWSRATFFHLDEYVGITASHPGSFRGYLRERIVDRLRPGRFVFVEGDAPDPEEECRRLGQALAEHTVDAAFIGIGENGHIAFNDPPADFETEEPFLVVKLDEACRRQQLGEGWFPTLEDVPREAITMSVRQILKARKIFCMVPDRRKAEAVRDCLEAEISPRKPCSILRTHPDTVLFLDRESASLLSGDRKGRQDI